jgi:hypothetical protein
VIVIQTHFHGWIARQDAIRTRNSISNIQVHKEAMTDLCKFLFLLIDMHRLLNDFILDKFVCRDGGERFCSIN